MHKIETITVSDASKRSGASLTTIRKWCVDLEIGYKIAGRWVVVSERLQEVLLGKRHYPFRYNKKGEASAKKIRNEKTCR